MCSVFNGIILINLGSPIVMKIQIAVTLAFITHLGGVSQPARIKLDGQWDMVGSDGPKLKSQSLHAAVRKFCLFDSLRETLCRKLLGHEKSTVYIKCGTKSICMRSAEPLSVFRCTDKACFSMQGCI